MANPYKDCSHCPVKVPCKIRSGEIKPPNMHSCKPKVFLDRALQLSQIPEVYREANVYNFKDAKGNNVTKDKVSALVETVYEDTMKGRNICITGKESGIGKTYLACVLMNHFIYKASQKLSPLNAVALFVDYSYLMDRLRYSDEPEVDVLFELVQKVPLLILDDIGSGTISDFVREQTFIIANNRLQDRLSTIITSNLDTVGLKSESVLGTRIQSRLTAGALLIEMTGKDRRSEGVTLIV